MICAHTDRRILVLGHGRKETKVNTHAINEAIPDRTIAIVLV